MSNTNRVAIRAVVEASFGVVPAAPDMRDLCITGAPGLAFTPETTVSEKIRSDRQIDDLPLIGGEAGGDITSELAFGVHDFFLEGAFFNSFQIRNSRLNDEVETQITAANVGVDFTVTSGTVPIVDDIVRGEGFGEAGNNAYHIIDGVPTATAFTTATAVAEAVPPNQARLKTVGRRSAAGDLDLTISGSTGTLVATILDFTTLDLEAGDWVALDGFPVEPLNEGFYRISITPTATTLTFDIVPVGAVTEAPATAVDVYMGERLINGTVFQSYTLEEEFEDHSPVTFQYFRGMAIDGMVLTAPSQSIVTLDFTFSGKDAFYSENGALAEVPGQLPAVDAAGRVDLATTVTLLPVTVLNSSSNVARISRGGVPITGANFVLEASVEIANNLRQLTAVGFLGAVSIGDGEFGVTGSLNAYFDDSSLARDVVSNAETSFDMRFVDADGHSIVIDAPRIKFSEGAPDVPGKNEDVTIALAYQAIRHPVFNQTLLWQRFSGSVASN
jgi:hypothetical protein